MYSKKIIIINIIITFLLSFLIHFFYEWFPNPVFAIFFSVNESIWEHMKMLFTTILISDMVSYFIFKNNNEFNNYFLITYLKSIIAIPIYLIIFLPIYNNIGENMFIAISVMLITMILVNIIGYKLMSILNPINNQKIISIILIILTYIIMGYLTYNPPHTQLFLDTKEEKYGINDYLTK